MSMPIIVLMLCLSTLTVGSAFLAASALAGSCAIAPTAKVAASAATRVLCMKRVMFAPERWNCRTLPGGVTPVCARPRMRDRVL